MRGERSPLRQVGTRRRCAHSCSSPRDRAPGSGPRPAAPRCSLNQCEDQNAKYFTWPHVAVRNTNIRSTDLKSLPGAQTPASVISRNSTWTSNEPLWVSTSFLKWGTKIVPASGHNRDWMSSDIQSIELAPAKPCRGACAENKRRLSQDP